MNWLLLTLFGSLILGVHCGVSGPVLNILDDFFDVGTLFEEARASEPLPNDPFIFYISVVFGTPCSFPLGCGRDVAVAVFDTADAFIVSSDIIDNTLNFNFLTPALNLLKVAKVALLLQYDGRDNSPDRDLSGTDLSLELKSPAGEYLFQVNLAGIISNTVITLRLISPSGELCEGAAAELVPGEWSLSRDQLTDTACDFSNIVAVEVLIEGSMASTFGLQTLYLDAVPRSVATATPSATPSFTATMSHSESPSATPSMTPSFTASMSRSESPAPSFACPPAC